MGSKVEYEVHQILRQCCFSGGCDRVVSHFAAEKGEDPQTVKVWCRRHEHEAWRTEEAGAWA
jgi:hypothetical protein